MIDLKPPLFCTAWACLVSERLQHDGLNNMMHLAMFVCLILHFNFTSTPCPDLIHYMIRSVIALSVDIYADVC